MKKRYSRVLFLLFSVCIFADLKAQNPVNAGPDIFLPCNTNCTNIQATLSSMPSVATNTYAVSSVPYAGNYGPYTAGTNYNLSTDDAFGSLLNLPFTFCFYGQNFNTVVLGSNGNISFTAAPNSFDAWVVTNPIPSANYAGYSIMGDYCDLYPNAASIKYHTVGVAPNRRFVVNYNMINYFFASPSATFQIVLHETTNIVEVFIQYAPNLAGGGNAIVGIQQNGTTALAAPGRNSQQGWSVQNTVNSPSEGWRWTPTGGTSGGAPLSVALTNINGLLVQPGIPVPNGPNYVANFNNICPTADTTDYIVEAVYVTCAGNTTFKDTVRIIKTVTPPPTVTSPVVVCQFAPPPPLVANGQNLLWYTVPVGGAGSPVTPILNTAISGLDTFWVSQTIAGCESIRVPIYINIKPTPTVVAGSNSPVCAGTTINLTTTGSPNPIPPLTTYQWYGPNGFNSTLANPNINFAQPVNAGVYTLTATVNGCSSAPSTVQVQVQPNPFIAIATAQSATTCTGTGTITLSGLTANTTYTVNYSLGGTPQPPVVITSSVAGQVLITGLGAGTYTNISVTIGACTSNTMAGPYNINQPSGITITTTSTNPTTCGGTNGTITINGLTNGVNYVLNYVKNGVAQPPVPFTASGTSYTINNLTAGTYTNLLVTIVSNNCPSNTIASIILTDPNAPAITITFTNPTSCNSNTGSITLSGLVNGNSYTINYTKNGTAQPPLTQIAAAGAVTISNLGAGTYTGISVTYNGCTSNVVTANLVDPAAPVIAVTANNPTGCNTNNGSIVLTGLTNGSSYTINYTKNGTPQTAITQAAAGGAVTISNLSAGNYTGITVTLNGCISNIVTATLVDPPGPVITMVSNNPTACGTSTGSIVLSGLTTGSSYVINYSKNGTPQTAITQTAAGGSVTINGLTSGTYSNITVTFNGCVSNVLGPITLSDPSAPATPVANGNGPLCAGQTLTLTANSTTPGVTYQWIGPVSFSSTAQNPSINNIQLNQAGIYSVTASLNGCTSAAGTYNLVVNPAPAQPNAGPNDTVCLGDNIVLNALPNVIGGQWSWTSSTGYTANTQNTTINNATAANSGAYYVTVAVAGCPSIADTVNILVVQPPSIQYTSVNPTTCGNNDGSITLNSLTTGSSYVINYTKNSTPQPAITQTAVNNSVTITGLTAGTYTNISVTLNGCQSNIVGPIVISDPTVPPTPVANNNGPLCEGDALNLTASTVAGATYSWTGPGFGTPNTNQNPTINTTTVADAGAYSVVAIVNGCQSLPGVTNVVINPVPATPVLTGTTTDICEGGSINLVSILIPGVNYNWSGPNLYSSTQQNPTITNAQPNMSGTYTLVVDNGICDATASVTVTVNPIPAAPAANDIEVCQYDIVQLTAQGQNLLWYENATGGVGTATMTANTQTPGGPTYYYVSQTVNGCESPRRQVGVTVKPQPVLPATQTSYTYCQYDTATQLTATGNNLQWYPTPTGGNPLPGAPTPNTSIPGTFNYYVTQTDNGCESNRAEIEVIIHPQPGLPVVEQITICQDEDNPVLNAQGQNLLWYDSATGGTGSPTPPTPSTTDVGVTDYYVSQTINGCEGDRALIRVTVNPKVVADITLDQDSVCDSYPLLVTFTGIAPAGATYDWSFDGASDVEGEGAGPYTIEWDTEGTKTITLTVTNLNCTSTITRTVQVLPTPDPDFELPKDVCINEEIRVQVGWNQMDLPGYNWNFGDAIVTEGTGGGPGPYTLKWNSPGQKVVSMSLTNIPCPSLPKYDTINVHHPLAKIASTSSSEICTSDSVLFTAQPGLDYQYEWLPTAYFGEETNSLSVWGTVRKAGYVWLNVTDRWGCKATDSVLLQPKSCCEVFMPNTFTPNGDGKNDVFRMVTQGNHAISVFMIMDRWGKRVFETINQYEAWDGSYNGEAQDMGTYQYYLRYRCADSQEVIEMKGDVILLR